MKSLPSLFVSVRPHQAGLFCARQNNSFLTKRVALVATILCLASSAAPALAQTAPAAINPAASTAPSAGSGRISGRVLNIANGQYLGNAQVTVKETKQTVRTDKFGGYVLVDVPSGQITLEAFYTGLDTATITVTVASGDTHSQDINLTSKARYGQDGSTLKLDPFSVSADRETNAQTIAVNERRFAPNIKNVSSTDTLGGVLGNSVGEFLKAMPGITAEYDTMDASGLNLRGLGSDKTAVTFDGIPGSNIFVLGPTRAVDMRSMSLNDIARIEVTKMPTPSMAADSLAGSVNMVRKNSFERKGRELKYSFSIASTDENLRLKKSPSGFGDQLLSTLRPGASIDFTLPITDRFGLVIAALAGNTMGEQHFAAKLWQTSGTGTNASTSSINNPFLQSMQYMDGNRYMMRNSLSIKGDWKVGDFSVLSFGAARNTANTDIGVMLNQFSTGINGSPTVASGTTLSFDPTQTLGATGRGSLLKTGRMQSLEQGTNTLNLNYNYDDGNLKVDSGFGLSESTARRRYEDTGLGFFNDVNVANRDPVRVNFRNIGTDFPATIEVFNDSNQSYDWRTLTNYRPTFSTSNTTLNLADSYVGFVNAKRRLNYFSFPVSVQTGLHHRLQSLDFRQQNIIWDFQGPDGLSPTASAVPYGNQVYVNVDHLFGFRNVDFPSSYRAFQAFKSNPLLYGKSNARLVAEERFRRENSEKFEEKVTAAYIQGEAKLFNGRLNVLGGVRFEHTQNDGLGSLSDPSAVFQRNTAGKFILDGTGNPIRKPAAGAVGSLSELNLILTERAQMSNRTYSGYYPSLHLTYSVKENLLVRAAYARTYGRPDYVDVLPRTVVTIPSIDNPDPIGNLTVRNPTLNPWTADNYDLSLEYYTKDGGVFSAGVFLKELKNFFANTAQVATPQLLSELGLSQDYVGWTVNTKFNSGDARISGVEFDVRQSLRKFGGWARYFTLFANATKLNLQSSAVGAFSTSFSAQGGGSYIPESANWGLTFANKRLTTNLRWNYRGLQKLTPVAAFGPDAFQYLKVGTTLDVSMAYQFHRRFSFNVNAINVGETPQILLRYGSSTPDYAKQFRTFSFGVQLSAGITGTF